MAVRVLITSLLWLFIDLYFFQALKNTTHHKLVWWIYWLYDAVILLLVLYYFFVVRTSPNPPASYVAYWVFGLLLISFVPKLFAIPVLLLEDIWRGLSWAYRSAVSMFSPSDPIYMEGRRKFVSQLALGIAAIPFASLIYGILKGRYDYQVRNVVLKFKDLPEAFHGIKITQLSDIHAGSFDNKEAVERGIALANQQKSDLILFTGDLVNNRADEMNEWKKSFTQLQAPMGKYSILGNHDYGNYSQWESEQAKADNFRQLLETHKEIGFRLLANEAIALEKSGQQIYLMGVENWGKGRFPKYGDLAKSALNVPPDAFKILMSHDPSHWEAKVLPFEQHVHVTLSGHTHGMQFGVEIKGYKWSPVKYLYRQWAGLYQKNDHYLYVNRGFGFIGYPGRVGILPEITVITLEKA